MIITNWQNGLNLDVNKTKNDYTLIDWKNTIDVNLSGAFLTTQVFSKVMKKVLVTGAAGFIGFSICNKLLEFGIDVCGLDNLNN